MRIYKEDMNTRGWGLRWGSNYQFINYFPHLAWHRLPHFHSTLCKGCSKPTSPPIYAFTSTQIGKFRDQAGIAPDLFALFSSGGVNINEVVLRQGLGLVQMTKRHGIEFPEHSRHFEKNQLKKVRNNIRWSVTKTCLWMFNVTLVAGAWTESKKNLSRWIFFEIGRW